MGRRWRLMDCYQLHSTRQLLALIELLLLFDQVSPWSEVTPEERSPPVSSINVCCAHSATKWSLYKIKNGYAIIHWKSLFIYNHCITCHKKPITKVDLFFKTSTNITKCMAYYTFICMQLSIWHNFTEKIK